MHFTPLRDGSLVLDIKMLCRMLPGYAAGVSGGKAGKAATTPR